VPDIHIRREHALGLPKARELAWQWAEEVEQQFGLACTVIEGDTSDTVEFTRTGVDGRLIVAPDHFELDAKLGFLLGAFSRKIETEIEHNLDKLLGQAARKPARPAGGKAAVAKGPVAKAPAAKGPSAKAGTRKTAR
jgi:putative polyhydroxyalkanoate system protein